MNGWELGDEVLLPGGLVGTVMGVVRLNGRVMVIVSPLPEEILVDLASARGFTTLAMYAEENVRRVE